MTTALDILIRARDEASSTIRGVGNEADRLDSSMGSTTTKTSRLGGVLHSTMGKVAALAGGAFAVKQAFDFGADLVKSAEEAKAASRRAFAAIRSDSDKAGISLKGLSDWSTKFGNTIAQDDEAVLGTSARLTQMLNLTKMFGKGNEGDGLTSITTSLYDMSAATGKSTSMLTRLFANVANDPAVAATSLLKLGVITKGQAEQYKKMAENGKSAAASQAMFGAISQKYAGQAAKAVTPSQRLGAVWDNLKETLGGFLLPLFSKAVGWLSDLALGFTNLLSGGASVGGMFAGIVEWLNRAWQTVKPFVDILKGALLNVWRALVETYEQSLAPAVRSFVGAFKKAWPVISAIGKAILIVNGVVLLLALKAIPPLIKVVGFLLGILIRLAGFLIQTLAAAFKTAWDVGKVAFGAIRDIVVGAWERIRGVWGGVREFFRGIWDGVKEAARAAFNGIAALWNNTVGRLSFHVPSWVPKIGGMGFDVPDIPYMAQGGIVTRATLAVIGEAGPEAVIPLSRLNARGSDRGGPMVVRLDRRRFSEELSYDATYRGW